MIFTQMSQSVSNLMKKIHHLPFNVELANGTLPKEKFIFYLIQDAIYLADFSRALAMTAVRLIDIELMQQFMEFSKGAITAERELHVKYLRAHTSEQQALLEPTPACFMYTNYLLTMASTATVEEAVASLLPCFYVYREVGKEMTLRCNHYHNPYEEWIHVYSGKEFSSSVDTAIAAMNKLGTLASPHLKEKMLNAFLKSTKLEWLFWDSAYQQEKWPI